MGISVPLEELHSGMVLAEPVFNRWGQILLNKGCKLTPRHISVLKTWGVAKADIGNIEGEEEVARIDQETLARAQKQVNKRLFWEPRTDFEKEIIQLAVRQTALRSRERWTERPGAKEKELFDLSATGHSRPESKRTA
ncbi:MAG: hypothetical protein AB1585_14575 [Thermodesulfobacteriota bacterium]